MLIKIPDASIGDLQVTPTPLGQALPAAPGQGLATGQLQLGLGLAPSGQTRASGEGDSCGNGCKMLGLIPLPWSCLSAQPWPQARPSPALWGCLPGQAQAQWQCQGPAPVLVPGLAQLPQDKQILWMLDNKVGTDHRLSLMDFILTTHADYLYN